MPARQDAEKVRQRRSHVAQTLNIEENISEVGGAEGAFPFAKARGRERTAHTKCGLYLLGPSLAAALLDSLFEHPA